MRWLADRIRRVVTVGRVERAIAKLMKTDLRLIIPDIGGCAVDVDTEQEYDVIRHNYDRLYAEVKKRAAEQTALSASASGDPS